MTLQVMNRTLGNIGRSIGALGSLALALAVSGCATRHSLFSDYYSATRETPRSAQAGRETRVLFLIDGLAYNVLARELRQRKLPSIQRHFFENGSRLGSGRAVFPSLTYPNLASILTSSPVHEHPVIGNRARLQGETVNFEKPWSARLLNEALYDRIVFQRLGRENRKSVSLSQYLSAGATTHIPTDLRTGAAYLHHDYEAIDRRTLQALENLISRTEPRDWPEFLFVHLIGFDGLAHDHGPDSARAQAYLRKLDEMLAPVLSLLRSAESGRKIVSILTADHGFVPVRGYLDLEAEVSRLLPEAELLNQSRIASLHFPKGGTEKRAREAALLGLARTRGIELVADREGNRIRVRTGRSAFTLELVAGSCRAAPFRVRLGTETLCPEEWDRRDESGSWLLHPYLISGIASYFYSPHRPDALVTAAEGVSFTRGSPGQHGGFTLRERQVPVLARNAAYASGLPTHELLSDLARGSAGGGEPAHTNDSGGLSEVLELSAPNRISFLAVDGGHALRSGVSPGLSLAWRQSWSALVSSVLGYRVAFEDFGAKTAGGNSLEAGAGALHLFTMGGAYRFGERQNVSLQWGIGQSVLTREQAGGLLLERPWTPELTLGTRSRIFSTGFGDLSWSGAFSVLFPGSSRELEPGFGFRERAELGFEQPVRRSDLLVWSLGLEHQSQGAGGRAHSAWSLTAGISYGLSFY